MSEVEVRPSRIEWLGIFALRAFAGGETITRVRIVREITPESPIREDLGERIDHCAYPEGRVVLIAFPERHVNHSCDPNAYERFEGPSSSIVAIRDIARGEETTIDYNINIAGGSAWPWRCAMPLDGGRRFLPAARRMAAPVPAAARGLVRRSSRRALMT